MDWWKIVWSSMVIPRHAFITWLAVRDCIDTGERMQRWGYHGNVLCVFCRSCIEGRNHLFFQCGFSKPIWQVILQTCLVDEVHTCWGDVMCLGLKSWKKNLKSTLCRLRWQVRTKFISLGWFKRTGENEALCESWGMHVKILC